VKVLQGSGVVQCDEGGKVYVAPALWWSRRAPAEPGGVGEVLIAAEAAPTGLCLQTK